MEVHGLLVQDQAQHAYGSAQRAVLPEVQQVQHLQHVSDRKLTFVRYSDVTEFNREMSMIWSNAYKCAKNSLQAFTAERLSNSAVRYNKENTRPYQAALKAEKLFSAKMQGLGPRNFSSRPSRAWLSDVQSKNWIATAEEHGDQRHPVVSDWQRVFFPRAS